MSAENARVEMDTKVAGFKQETGYEEILKNPSSSVENFNEKKLQQQANEAKGKLAVIYTKFNLETTSQPEVTKLREYLDKQETAINNATTEIITAITQSREWAEKTARETLAKDAEAGENESFNRAQQIAKEITDALKIARGASSTLEDSAQLLSRSQKQELVDTLQKQYDFLKGKVDSNIGNEINGILTSSRLESEKGKQIREMLGTNDIKYLTTTVNILSGKLSSARKIATGTANPERPNKPS